MEKLRKNQFMYTTWTQMQKSVSYDIVSRLNEHFQPRVNTIFHSLKDHLDVLLTKESITNRDWDRR